MNKNIVLSFLVVLGLLFLPIEGKTQMGGGGSMMGGGFGGGQGNPGGGYGIGGGMQGGGMGFGTTGSGYDNESQQPRRSLDRKDAIALLKA